MRPTDAGPDRPVKGPICHDDDEDEHLRTRTARNDAPSDWNLAAGPLDVATSDLDDAASVLNVAVSDHNLEDFLLNGEDFVFAVENSFQNVEDKVLGLEEKVFLDEEKVHDVEDKVLELEEEVLRDEEKVHAFEDKVFELVVGRCNVQDKVLKLEEKVLDVQEKVLTDEDRVHNVQENVLDVLVRDHVGASTSSRRGAEGPAWCRVRASLCQSQKGTRHMTSTTSKNSNDVNATRGTMTTTKKTTKATKSTSTLNPQVTPAPASPPTPTPPATPPDPNAALRQYAQQTVSELDAVEVSLGGDPPLSPAQKRHAAKLRKGGAVILAQLGNLATQQQLESPSLQVGDMTMSLGKAQALQPLADRLAAFSKHVNDVIFSSQSAALVIGQQFYALLQRRAKTDSELAASLAPVMAFFARRPVAKKPGELSKPQKKATKKAEKTLKKNAPELLASPTETPTTPAAPVPPTPAAAPAPATTATHS